MTSLGVGGVRAFMLVDVRKLISTGWLQELQVRHLRQQPAESSSSSSTGVMALGAAGVVVASAQAAKRTVRRAQVVRQATAVAEKTFTKMPASAT